MKKQPYAIEFVCILCIFALPPLFMHGSLSQEKEAVYPVQTFLLAAFAGLLLYVENKRNGKRLYKNSFSKRIMQTSASLVTFGILCLSFAVASLCSYIFQPEAPQTHLLLPHTAVGIINCIIGTVCAVFYEEVLYRLYLPTAALRLFGKKYRLLCEGGAVVLFSLGHLYLGIFGCLNALVAGIALRRCMIKTESLVPPFGVHLLYNALMLAFSFLS